MNIIKAQSADLVEIFYLLKRSVKEMNSNGWLCCNLEFELVRKDVEGGFLFLLKTDYHSLGLISFTSGVPKEHEEVKWHNSSKKPLTINRLVVHPNWRKHGITDMLLKFAEEYAKEQGYTSLRLDVYSENEEVISIYNNFQFKQTGQMLLKVQETPFYCFEKTF
jgi:GNAT superfamily N-acetyltransferase